MDKEAQMLAFYDFFKEGLLCGMYTASNLEILADLLSELVARKKEEGCG